MSLILLIFSLFPYWILWPSTKTPPRLSFPRLQKVWLGDDTHQFLSRHCHHLKKVATDKVTDFPRGQLIQKD